MTGPVFEAVTNYRGRVDTRLANGQNSRITTGLRGKGSGAWVNYALRGDESYPMILNGTLGVYGTTGAQSAGTAHTHAAGTSLGASSIYYTIAQNNSLGSYVTITDTYQADQFSVGVSVNSAMAGGTIDFEIFRVAPDGSLKQVGASGNISSISTTPHVITLTSFGQMITREGEKYALRVVNRSSPARTVSILSLDGMGEIGVPFNSGWTTIGATDTNKTSYTAAQALTAQSLTAGLPWFMIGLAAAPTQDRYFDDDFNRINLGPAWAIPPSGYAPGPVISGGLLTYNGTTNGQDQFITCIYPAASDAIRVDADVWDIATSGSANGVSLKIAQDRENESYVALDVFIGSAQIRTFLASTSTVRDTYTGDTDASTWSLYYEPTPKTYTALKDGEDVGLSWTDSTPVIPHDENRRYGGIGLTRVGGVNGGRVDNFVLRDWAP